MMKLNNILFCTIAICLFVTNISAREKLRIVVNSGPGSQGIYDFLRGQKKYELARIKSLKELKKADVLIISNRANINEKDLLRQRVEEGLNVFITHSASPLFFPEIASNGALEKNLQVSTRQLQVIRKHPITEGLDKRFLTQYYDHIVFFPYNDQAVLIEDVFANGHRKYSSRFKGTQVRWDKYVGGNALLAYGVFGKGKVILYGGLIGLNIQDKETIPEKNEQRLLLNSIAFLSSSTALKNFPSGQQTKYQAGRQPKAPKYDTDAISVLASAYRQAVGTDRADEYVKISTQKVNEIAIHSFPLRDKQKEPVAIVIDRKEYPIGIKGEYGFFVASLQEKESYGILKYHSKTKDNIIVKRSDDNSSIEVTTKDFRIVLAAENNEATIQFLQIFDHDWHHTWDGLERNSYSASLIRLASSLWPYYKLPPSIDHERGFVETKKYSKIIAENPIYVDLKVANGKIRIYHSGHMKVENFSNKLRVSTWVFDYYLHGGEKYLELAAHDMPSINGNITCVKENRYALKFSNLELSGKIGVTGMAPGIMRSAEMQNGHIFVIKNAEELDAYKGFPNESKLDIAETDNNKYAKSLRPLRLPKKKVLFKRLLKERKRSERGLIPAFYPDIFVPVEIYSNMVDKNIEIASWELSTDLVQLDTERNEDPYNEDSAEVFKRIFFKLKKGTSLFFKEKNVFLYGKDKSGKIVLVQPLALKCMVTLPMGIFTYGPQWMKREKQTPADQWKKLMRDIALMNMDFEIHRIHCNPNETRETPDIVFARIKRYGYRLCASFSMLLTGLKHVSHKDRQKYAKMKVPADFDENFIPYFKKYKNNENIIAWYLSDEFAQGKVTDPEKLPLGFQWTNYMYELANKYVPNEDKINLTSTWFTDFKSIGKYLKTDIIAWDPYYATARALQNDVKKARIISNSPKQNPMWVTLKSCGPSWYDSIDLYFDIRLQTAASYYEGVDGINYFMYAHWLYNMEESAWYTVFPGKEGPVASPRRHILSHCTNDIMLLTTVEYLLHMRGKKSKEFRKAKALAVSGDFYQMHEILNKLLEKLE